MSDLGVALLGCGFVGFRHATAIRHVQDATDLPVRLAVVCDPDHQRADAFAETFGAPSIADHREVLVDPAVGAVYVCTPTATHLELVAAAAEAGKAIFCEKPLGRDLAEAEAVAEAARGVPNQVGLVLRSSVVYQGLRTFLGELGDLMTAVFRDDQHWPLERHYGSGWRADREVAGGGTLLEHSIHDLDLVRWLFGRPEVRAAVVREHADRPGIEDLAVALMDVPGGPTVTLTSLWHEIDQRRSERNLEVFGARGWARVTGDFWGSLEYQGPAGPVRAVPATELLDRGAEALGLDGVERELWRVSPLEDYWFLRAVVLGEEPTPAVSEGLEAHRLVEAVYRAGGRGGES